MPTKTMLLTLAILALCFFAEGAEGYYKPLPYKMTYSEELAWRDSHAGGWDRNYPTRAELGLTLPSIMTFDIDREFGAMSIYLVTAWFIWPFTMLLLLVCENKTARLIGLAMLIPWLVFSWDRKMEFFCIWTVCPAWIIGATIRNIKKSVVG